jgi:hypothetical protein
MACRVRQIHLHRDPVLGAGEDDELLHIGRNADA